MLRKIKDSIGIGLAFLGVFGLAGAIENELSIVRPLILTLVGVILLINKEVKSEKTNSNSNSDSNRLWFLH